MHIIGFDDFTRKLAIKLQVSSNLIENLRFSDGEICTKIPLIEDKHVVFVNRMKYQDINPNVYLIENYLVIKTLKDLGVKKIDLVMPYMVYGRQDKTYSPGEPLSARYVIELLANAGASRIFTVSSHFERNKKVVQSKIPLFNLNGFSRVADFIRDSEVKNSVLLGADAGVSEATKFIAGRIGTDYSFLQKERKGGHIKILSGRTRDLKDKNVIIIDDIISSGETMERAIEYCNKCGASFIQSIALHGIFANDSLQRIKNLADRLIVSDTIQTPVSKISIIDLVAESLKR